MFLFVNDGVYMSPSGDPSSISFKTRVLTLVDADATDRVPAFLLSCSKYLVAFISYPQEERWKGLRNATDWELAIMNPWTRKEISEVLADSLPCLDLQTDDLSL
jgi:hypothetical protein